MYPRMDMAPYHHETASPSPHHYNHHPHMSMQPMMMMAGPSSHRMTPEPGMASYHLEAIAQANSTMRKVQTHNGNSRFKTELCRSWSTSGACRYGDKCQFAHGTDELRPLQRHPKYKTELCRYVVCWHACKHFACLRACVCSSDLLLGNLLPVKAMPTFSLADTPPCLCSTFHTHGICPYGPRCHFLVSHPLSFPCSTRLSNPRCQWTGPDCTLAC